MRARLQRIEHALQRVDNGRFGICETCQQSIDSERLLALPSAELCIDCQRQLERQVLGRRWVKELRRVAA
jgi:RNA polymerase-binding transcription factor DksA